MAQAHANRRISLTTDMLSNLSSAYNANPALADMQRPPGGYTFENPPPDGWSLINPPPGGWPTPTRLTEDEATYESVRYGSRIALGPNGRDLLIWSWGKGGNPSGWARQNCNVVDLVERARRIGEPGVHYPCLLYTSDAADE